jgi:Clp amino terminal domain, pathogenicity island component
MEERGERICALAEEAARAEDAESALRALAELRPELEEFVCANVERALASGRSFGDVARALRISRQAAHRRYRDLAPEPPRARPRRLAATDDARTAVRLARERAIAAGVPPRSEHVLLGILGTHSDAARALQAEGVTFEAAKACARPSALNDGDAGSSLRRILRQAGQVAVARGDERLGSDQLLLAALADRDGGALRTLVALGVTPASIRTRLGCGTDPS